MVKIQWPLMDVFIETVMEIKEYFVFELLMSIYKTDFIQPFAAKEYVSFTKALITN